MTDTHAHLDHEAFDSDRDEMIQRTFDNGIKKIVTIGCDEKEISQAIELAEKYENIYAAVGFHPENCKTNNCGSDSQIARVAEKLKTFAKHLKVVAIGEIGLDYFYSNDEEIKSTQKELFIAQLKLARELGLPVIIHCRASKDNPSDAYDDLLEMLKNYGGKDLSRCMTGIKGVIHCFCGTREQAKQFSDLGLHISFTGNITYFKKDSAEVLQAVREIPLNKILIETDCPFLSPIPHREKRNEPMFVKYVAEKIAEIKEISVDEVERMTDKNAEKLFRLS